MTASPHDRFVDALEQAGWTATDRVPVGSGPNPTRVDIRRGRLHRRLLVYAWRITSEGKGRKRKDREDLDYRIQTTRSHEGPLQTPTGYVTCGIGWDEEREVFAAFDPWVKRNTGTSSSVHFTRALLDEAASSGTARRDPADHGPQIVFRPGEINEFLSWAIGLQKRRLLALDPKEFGRKDEDADVVVDPWDQPSANWLRPGDHLVVERHGALLDNSVWVIESVEVRPQKTQSGRYNRPYLGFRCKRYGVIRDPQWLSGATA
jgi:hypothetical protein